MARIYLSSTYSDLVTAREAVYRSLRQLRHDVIAMEDYVATDARPLDKCLADVRACDIYVGIFAWRYGYIPPDQEQSITELEFREAARLHKSLLPFLVHEEAAWPRTFIDRDSGSIEALRAELSRDYLVSFFRTTDELRGVVSVAVANLSTGMSAPASIHVMEDLIEVPHWSTIAEVRFSVTNLSTSVLKLKHLLLRVEERAPIDKIRLRKSGAPLREFNLVADVTGTDEVDLLKVARVQFVLEPFGTDAFRLSFVAPEGYLYACRLHACLDDLAGDQQAWIASLPFRVESLFAPSMRSAAGGVTVDERAYAHSGLHSLCPTL